MKNTPLYLISTSIFTLILGFTSPLAFAKSGLEQILPKILITTPDGNPVLTKEYVKVQMQVDPNGQNPSWALSQKIKIKVRGNSTSGFEKKPYKFKFSQPVSILGLPSDNEWTLIANYTDKTMLRNSVAYEMSRRLGMEYTPRSRFVDVVLNGQEQGTYELTESIKITPDRVNAVPADVTGGYLFEMDRRRDATFQLTTARSEPYAIREPEHPSLAQLYYLQTYLQKTEDVLHSKDFADPVMGYAKYIDVDSFINWYLVNEIMKNPDAGNFSSIYFHKPSGQKIKMGPVWDFDISSGNIEWTEVAPTEGWWIKRRSPWFKVLFQDPAFGAKVRTRWNEMKSRGMDVDSVMKYIDDSAAHLELSQQKNFEVWNILNKKVWPNRIVMGSYAAEVGEFKRWLKARMEWMDVQFNPPEVPISK